MQTNNHDGYFITSLVAVNWRPIAGVDVPLILPFSFRAISLLLGCGCTDGPCAGAHAAWSCRVALNSCVPVSAATPRHCNTKPLPSPSGLDSSTNKFCNESWIHPYRCTLSWQLPFFPTSTLTVMFSSHRLDGTPSTLRADAAPVLGRRGAKRGAVCGCCAPLIIRGWG